MLAPDDARLAHGAVGRGVIRVQLDRAPGAGQGLLLVLRDRRGVAEHHFIVAGIHQAGACGAEARVQGQGFLEAAAGFRQVRLGPPVEVPQAALIEVPRVQVTRCLGGGPLLLGLAELRGDGGDDGFGHLVLQRKEILQDPVVALGPNLLARGCLDQLGGDADAVAALAQAAVQQVAHAQLTSHLLPGPVSCPCR